MEAPPFRGWLMKKHKLNPRLLVAIIATTFTIVSFAAAQKVVSDSELEYRAALHKQQVEGDLGGAIELYKSIASSKTADRTVKARALLQLGACYEKLGQESQAVY